jgi:hypothetical protein
MAPEMSGRTAWELARKQEGVINREQLHALGFTDDAIRHRIDRGRLRRIYAGVYAVGQLICPPDCQVAAVIGPAQAGLFLGQGGGGVRLERDARSG